MAKGSLLSIERHTDRYHWRRLVRNRLATQVSYYRLFTSSCNYNKPHKLRHSQSKRASPHYKTPPFASNHHPSTFPYLLQEQCCNLCRHHVILKQSQVFFWHVPKHLLVKQFQCSVLKIQNLCRLPCDLFLHCLVLFRCRILYHFCYTTLI